MAGPACRAGRAAGTSREVQDGAGGGGGDLVDNCRTAIRSPGPTERRGRGRATRGAGHDGAGRGGAATGLVMDRRAELTPPTVDRLSNRANVKRTSDVV